MLEQSGNPNLYLRRVRRFVIWPRSSRAFPSPLPLVKWPISVSLIVERAALLQGAPVEHPAVVIEDLTPVAMALSRLSAIDRRYAQPVVCSDAGGRYLGLVRVERMLALLDRT